MITEELDCLFNILTEQYGAVLETHAMWECIAAVGAKLSKDGNMYCFLWGDNIQEGVCGFGETIYKAAWNFYTNVKIEEARKESEDEKIRKHTIKIFDSLAPCHWDGNEKAKCIAYLEKQKEQKPIVYIPKFKVGDKVLSTNNPHLTYNIIEVGLINELGNPEYRVEILTDEQSDTPPNIKLIACQKMDSWDELIEQKPTEWSEEDEQCREDDLRTRFAFYTYKDEDSVLYLSNVFVEETSRNKGFGTKILQAAEKVAETIGAIRICLKVKQVSPANAWYRKHGYGYLTFEGEYDWLEKKLEYLKPKQPEVDLEKEIDRLWKDGLSEELSGPHNMFDICKKLARHFYELGLKARKEYKK